MWARESLLLCAEPMTTFLYLIGGILIIGALLIVAQSPSDPVTWVIAGALALCGAVFCWGNRG